MVNIEQEKVWALRVDLDDLEKRGIYWQYRETKTWYYKARRTRWL